MREILKILIRLAWIKIREVLVKFKILKLEETINKRQERLDESINKVNHDNAKLQHDIDKFLRRMRNRAEDSAGATSELRKGSTGPGQDNKRSSDSNRGSKKADSVKGRTD